MSYHADRNSSRVMINRAELVDIDDGGDLQLAKALGFAGENFSKVHRVQPFGLSSRPAGGAHGLILSGSGRRDMAALLGMEVPEFRPRNLEPNETVLYDGNGQAVSLIKRQIRIVSSNPVNVEAPRVNLAGLDGAAVLTTAGPSTKVFAVV